MSFHEFQVDELKLIISNVTNRNDRKGYECIFTVIVIFTLEIV